MDMESKEHRSLVDTLRKNGVSECNELFFFFFFFLRARRFCLSSSV
jgi:hypothetical protein